MKTWTPQDVAPDQVQSISWNGRLGRAARQAGPLLVPAHRRHAPTAPRRAARRPATSQRDAFDLYDHIFPIRGRHDFGGAGARFGAGRAGHIHQGQDMFARCGTPLVAARGGRVKFKQYHAAAGNYIVIDGDGTDVDYVYMHLDQPSPVQRGRPRVHGSDDRRRRRHRRRAWAATSTSSCGRGPGWYDGGKPFDPLPSLQAWDSWS